MNRVLFWIKMILILIAISISIVSIKTSNEAMKTSYQSIVRSSEVFLYYGYPEKIPQELFCEAVEHLGENMPNDVPLSIVWYQDNCVSLK